MNEEIEFRLHLIEQQEWIGDELLALTREIRELIEIEVTHRVEVIQAKRRTNPRDSGR